MSAALAFSPDAAPATDRIVIVAGGPSTLDLLRLATVRSDDIVLVGAQADEATRRYARRFAVEEVARPLEAADLAGAAALLIAGGDMEEDNRIVRLARRAGLPVHVSGRALVSDFTLLEFLERRPPALAA